MSKRCILKFILIMFVLIHVILLVTFGVRYIRGDYQMVPWDVRNDQIDFSYNTTKREGQVKLIIVSRMRSGSTFTGDLFNHHSRVFYFYEPLWTIDFYFERVKQDVPFMVHPALFLREPMIYKSATKADQQISSLKENVIKATINCDFKSMYLGPLLVPMLYNESRTCKAFGGCAARNPGVLGLERCLPELEKVCRPASAIVMKVLRIRMKEVQTFLEADPEVKVVHLIRDPRGVLSSRKSTGLDKLYQQTEKMFCDSVAEDVQDSVSLKKKYPGRIMTARYEDLAQWPQDFTTVLLNFAGLSMEPELGKYIWEITSSKNSIEKESQWMTFRADSKRTAGLWRSSVSFEFVSGVDRDCRKLHELMGYVPFADKTALKNMDMPFFKDYREVPGLWNTTMQ